MSQMGFCIVMTVDFALASAHWLSILSSSGRQWDNKKQQGAVQKFIEKPVELNVKYKIKEMPFVCYLKSCFVSPCEVFVVILMNYC